MSTQSLANGVLAGEHRSIARAISVVETGSDRAHALLRLLFGRTGSARVVGVTGAPGVGKSTLVDKLTVEWRRTGRRVGILAVDPTSPFSGGAILGDRIRMQTHSGDDGVFVRSMATRGHLGGLAQATSDAVVVLDAAGLDVVLIETVGVGQGEVDVATTADVCVVVTVPGAGDDVQALKAGIMEIGDVFVVNKADRDGVDRAVAEIQSALMLQEHEDADEVRRPPVLKTEATTGSGVRELLLAIDAAAGDSARDVRLRSRAAMRLQQALMTQCVARLDQDPATRVVMQALVDGITRREVDPHTAATRVLDGLWAVRDAMTTTRAVLDHVGIAVADLDEALAFYRDALELDVSRVDDVPSQRVRAHFVPTGPPGGVSVELLEATAQDSPIARFLSRRGPGLHHITFRVENLGELLAQLKRRGVRLIDEAPRPGAERSQIAFVHPASTHGVLVELKEEWS